MDFPEGTEVRYFRPGTGGQIECVCVNPDQIVSRHRYDTAVVYERTVDPITGRVTYQFVVFDVPDKPTQVALARKLRTGGAINVHENRLDAQGRDNPIYGDKLAVNDGLARECLSPDEYKLYELLRSSRETMSEFWSYIGSAFREGEEGHEWDTAFLDQPYDDSSRAARLGAFNVMLASE